MARKVAFFLLLLCAAADIACLSSSQSSFYRSFSLKELVQRNRSVICSANGGAGGGGGGGISAGTGGIGIGKQQSNSHKGESFSCQISNVEQFDEAKFIQALKESVEKDLNASKAKIVTGGNSNAASFYLEYDLKDIRGRIEISGTRSPGNYYSLSADLDEKNEPK